MFHRILIAYDGSQSAGKAFDRAIRHAAATGAEVAIIAVVSSSELAVDVDAQLLLEGAQNQLARQIWQLQLRGRLMGSNVSAMIQIGHPARQIARAAREWRADLIVTGHQRRGHALSWMWLSSSVSKQILRFAPCAVLVVPSGPA